MPVPYVYGSVSSFMKTWEKSPKNKIDEETSALWSIVYYLFLYWQLSKVSRKELIPKQHEDTNLNLLFEMYRKARNSTLYNVKKRAQAWT